MSDYPSLTEKVAFLRDPRTYGSGVASVEAIETHWSWVFLTETGVIKLKKPLKRPWIDLTTIAAREANCREELRLNRRLAEGVYRRVMPLRRSFGGRLKLGEGDDVVDWLLEMERLPAPRMLDTLIRQGQVRTDEVTAIGMRLGEFYAALSPQVEDGRLYLDHLRTEAVETRRVLESVEIGIDADSVRRLLDDVDRLFTLATPMFEERIAASRIVEGHGDLRPEHVCLLRRVQIFDCLEFDRGMRILDPYDEVNYLGLECAVLGAGWIRPQLLAVLDDVLGGRPPPLLMVFYSAFRATLRSRICLAHLDDEVPMEPGRWPGEARAYLRMAQEELEKL